LSPNWKDFSLRAFLRRLEAHAIKEALRESKGKVSEAARLLGFKHHQSLISLLNTRHKELLPARSKIKKRRHHLLVHPKRKKKSI
jgi:AraC-like DNA-binding protein